MNPLMSRLIIDFYVRTPIDDRLLDRLIAILPTPEDNFKMKKGLLLRRIQTELNKAPISEKLMELLELTCNLDFLEGKPASEKMKKAYRAVVVDCTVKFLEDNGRNAKYIETLTKLWTVRVQNIAASENTGLLSEELWRWKDALEGVVNNAVLRDQILGMNTRTSAVKLVKGYLAEAWAELGPSHLQTVVDLIRNGRIVKKDAQDSITMDDVDMPQASALSSNGPAVDGDAASLGSVHNVSPDGENCKEKASIENEISAEQTGETAAIPISPVITDDDPAGKDDASLVRSGRDESLPLHEIPSATRKLEFLGEASPGACSSTMKRWTSLEEDTLRSSVSKFGKENWKQILDAYPDEFVGRTEAALKVKWRRIIKKRC